MAWVLAGALRHDQRAGAFATVIIGCDGSALIIVPRQLARTVSNRAAILHCQLRPLRLVARGRHCSRVAVAKGLSNRLSRVAAAEVVGPCRTRGA